MLQLMMECTALTVLLQKGTHSFEPLAGVLSVIACGCWKTLSASSHKNLDALGCPINDFLHLGIHFPISAVSAIEGTFSTATPDYINYEEDSVGISLMQGLSRAETARFHDLSHFTN